MKRALLVLVALLLCCPRIVWAAEFWPMEDGLVWRYGSTSGSEYDVTMNCGEGGCSRGRTITEPTYTLGDYLGFQMADNGDVLVGYSVTWDSRQLDPDEYFFDPPLVFLDLPLDVGKHWISACNLGVIMGTVLREETVVVPAGAYEVTVVRIVDYTATGRLSGDYYLNRYVGQVIKGGLGLAWFSGPVGVQAETWGGVKALYR